MNRNAVTAAGPGSPAVREAFPVLAKKVNGLPLVYLDSASTSLKPRVVLGAIRRYYEEHTANVHRSTHPFGEAVTMAYEGARDCAARFLNVRPDEIVFVRNTTEGINLVALGLGLRPTDEILVTPLEHHSNQLPWLSKARVTYLPLGADGLPDESRLDEFITPATRLLAVGLLSNVTGTRAKIDLWSRAARRRGIPLLLDGSQAGGHMPMDAAALGCDFIAFSGHKVCGPSGIGALWGKREWLERVKPPLLGGGMVHESRLDGYRIKEVPWCFEAGTPNVEGALGLAAALEFLMALGMEKVESHSLELGKRLYDGLKSRSRVRIAAPDCRERYGIISFSPNISGLTVESFGRMMADTHGILLSAGTHCAQPYHKLAGLPSTVRASTHVYTKPEEVDFFLEAAQAVL